MSESIFKGIPTPNDYYEILEVFKETHKLYMQAVKTTYLTHDLTRIMGNEYLLSKIESKYE